MNYTYIIIDDDQNSVLKTKALADSFQNLTCLAVASTFDDGINLILEHQPKLVFLEINPSNKESNLSFSLISELYRYLKVVPKIIITTNTKEYAFDALKYEVIDYMLKPLHINEFRKAIFKLVRDIEVNYSVVQPTTVSIQPKAVENIVVNQLVAVSDDFPEEEEIEEPINETLEDEEILFSEEEKTLEEEIIEEDIENETPVLAQEETEVETTNEEVETIQETEEENTETEVEVVNPSPITEEIITVQKEQPLIICVKSYGDYRYIDSTDILYFEADNNSTDIHLNNGEMITAFKTLKHFESVLPSKDFLRIHNSYIINVNQVSRIHTGNALCFIKNSTVKLPFSKSYKENVDLIITRIAGGNYLEI